MITYLAGDATKPNTKVSDTIFIAHVVNNVGKWGRGFTASIDKQWPEVGKSYRTFSPLLLGVNQLLWVTRDICVVNMCAQDGVGTGKRRLDYNFLRICLSDLSRRLKKFTDRGMSVSVHMPRIGTGLGGGEWEIIEPLIEEFLGGFDVYVYSPNTMGEGNFVLGFKGE